ncbi:MAG: hypothetical protein IKK32_00140 [Oscillospiraceae bacterium]|nr:hypothetical protein [Oscillospiraceae bacterium]
MNFKERNKDIIADILTTELIIIILFAVYRFFSSDFYGIHSAEEVPLWRIAYIISGRGNLPSFSGFGYSSFGYSLILAPLVFIFGGGSSAYSAALFINTIFLVASFFIAYKIALKLFPDVNKYFVKAAAFAVMLLPDIISSAYMTDGFAVSVFLTFMTLWFFVNMDAAKKPLFYVFMGITLSLLLWFCEGTMGIFVVGVLAFSAMIISKRTDKLSITAFFSSAGLGFVLFIVLRIVFSSVFSTEAEGFSSRGFLSVLSGKLIYISVSTLLFAFAGLLFAIMGAKNFMGSFILRYIKKVPADEFTQRQLFLIFLIISSVSFFLTDVIASLFAISPNSILSGKYGGLLLAPLMLIGILYLSISGKKAFAFSGIFSGVLILSCALFNLSGSATMLTGFSPASSASVAVFMPMGLSSFIIPALIIVAAFVYTFIIFISSKKIKPLSVFASVALSVIFICEGFFAVSTYSTKNQIQNEITENVISAVSENYSLPLYTNIGDNMTLAKIQFSAKRQNIGEISEAEIKTLGRNGLIITDKKYDGFEVVYEDASGYLILVSK